MQHQPEVSVSRWPAIPHRPETRHRAWLTSTRAPCPVRYFSQEQHVTWQTPRCSTRYPVSTLYHLPLLPGIALDDARLSALCRRWCVATLELFGSVIRDDFRPDSDVDVLVTFQPDANWSLLDHATMEDELAELFGRPVDLLSRRAVERSANPIRRASILESAVPLFAAPGTSAPTLSTGGERARP